MAKSKDKRHRLEMILAGLGVWTLPFLPRFLVVFLANSLAALGYLVAVRDRKIANANLICAFGNELSAKERRRIIFGSMRTFALLMLDLFWFHRFSEKRVNRFVHYDEESAGYYFKTKPAIVATGHIGNWEIGSLATGFRNEPLVSIAAEIGSPSMNRLLIRLREQSGQRIETQQGAVRALLKALKSGKRTALLLDQNTMPEDGGQFVNFLGLPAPMSSAASMLGFRTKAPILVTYCVGHSNGHYTLYCLPPYNVTDDNKDEAMQEIADRFSMVIRKHPDQWLWMYKRWKYIPDGHDGEGYPYYARPLNNDSD